MGAGKGRMGIGQQHTVLFLGGSSGLVVFVFP